MSDAVPQERTVVIQDESLRQFVGGFTSVPNRILRNNQISLGARMCYSMLLSYAWQEDFCFPAQVRLAEDLGIGERTVRQYLNELRDTGLISWKQRGLNKPNIYHILKLPALIPTDGGGHPGPANSAGPDRQYASAQDRHSASAYKDSEKNTHMVVNDVTPNDHENHPEGSRPTPLTPTISDRALRTKYHLTDDQVARVHQLVDKQIDILAAGDRNFAAYVKRSAEAVRDGLGDALDFKLSDFKQAATEIAVGSRPAYFHAMWTEERENRRSTVHEPHHQAGDGPQRLAELFARHESDPNGIDPRVARLIADAERRGFPVPAYIRKADIQAVHCWWASLTTDSDKRT